jgi:hypothetical protein
MHVRVTVVAVEKQQVLNIMKKSVEHKTRVLIFSTISV